MANQKRGLVRIATEIDRQGRMASGGAAAGAAGIDLGFGEVGRALENNFGRLAQKVGALADHAARKEGHEAGRVAGLDPEFRTRRDNTIRGEAFDAAGLDVYRSQMRQGIEADVKGIADKSGENTGEMRTGIAKTRAKWLAQVPRELRPDAEMIFHRSETALVRLAARRHATRIKAEQRAAIGTEVADGLKGLHQRAFALGLDKEADGILAGDIAQLRKVLSRTGVDGRPLVAPATAAKLLRGAQEEVTDARLLGAFDRIDGAAAKRAFLEKFEEDFGKSEGLASNYTLDGFRRIAGLLERELAKAETAEGAEFRVLAKEVNSFASLAGKGFTVPPDHLAALRGRIAQSGNAELAGALDSAEGLLKWQQYAAILPPAVLAGQLASLRADMQANGTSPEAVARLELGEKLLGEMRTELKRDPLMWAARVGLATPEPIRWGEVVDDSSGTGPVNLAAMDIKKRVGLAEDLAARNGMPVRYFTQGDRQELARIAQEGGPRLVQVASTIAEGFGDKADEAFREIAAAGKLKGGNVMAAIGGLVISGASPSVIQDAAQALALRRVSEFKSVAPAVEKSQPILTEVFGGAMRALPQTAEITRDLANAVYDIRAKRDGITNFNDDLYRSVVKELTGAVEVNGTTYGGIGDHRAGWFSGRKVMVPAGLDADRFDDLVGLITNADLDGTGQVPYAVNGQRLKADTLRRGNFVSLGSDRYRVALGDPEGADPQWLQDEDGRTMTFDLGILIPRLKKRRPDLWMEGR